MAIMPNTQVAKYIILSAILLILSYGLVKSGLEVFKGQKRLDDTKKEVTELQQKKEELEEGIEYKKTDEYVEERARNDLNLIKPGEKVYVVVGKDGYSEESDVGGGQKVLSGKDKKTVVDEGIKKLNVYKWFRLFF